MESRTKVSRVRSSPSKPRPIPDLLAFDRWHRCSGCNQHCDHHGDRLVKWHWTYVAKRYMMIKALFYWRHCAKKKILFLIYIFIQYYILQTLKAKANDTSSPRPSTWSHTNKDIIGIVCNTFTCKDYVEHSARCNNRKVLLSFAD